MFGWLLVLCSDLHGVPKAFPEGEGGREADE